MQYLNIFPSSPLFFPISIFLLFSILLPKAVEAYYEFYTNCNTSFDCGKFRGIGYPFWKIGRPNYCGHPNFQLDCQEDEATIDIMSQKFSVIHIDLDTQILKIARMNFLDNICDDQFVNTTLNFNLFNYTSSDENLTLFYDCSQSMGLNIPNISCPTNYDLRYGYFVIDTNLLANELIRKCKVSVVVPILRIWDKLLSNSSSNISIILSKGFEVRWMVDQGECRECVKSGGICVYNWILNEPCCFCPDYPTCNRSCFKPLVPATSPASIKAPRHKLNLALKLIIGFCAAGAGILLVGIPFFFYHRRNKKLYTASRLISQNNSSYSSSMVDLDQPGTYLGLQIFSYSELEEATKKFDSEKILGDGGFGIVYLGKLKDGRAVAVKRLYEKSYKRVEQFMNEIEILSRLRHQNLVSLYGCTSRHCRELILVYEYIPNGTVADHLHGEGATPGSLAWTTRMSISIETATALAYLHASDVIHRDVKTNNILLDNNFCVKVADFGLSRLYPTDVTHVSTAPQGTPGYVDPEYHDCYHLTKESDVYSFGVVLIELISSMPAVDITRKRHEVNLSHLAISKIQSNALHELVDPSIGFEADYKVKNMVTDVAELAFQCLQNEREMRPSMEEVLEALIGIQRKDYDIQKTSIDIPADDVVLLKNNPPTLSPDSVTAKWISTSSDFSG